MGDMVGRHHPGCCSSKDGDEPFGVAMVSTLSVPEKEEKRVETWRGWGEGRRLQRGSWAGEEEASLAPC